MLLRSRGEGGRAGLQAGRVGRGGDVGTAVAAGNGEKPGGEVPTSITARSSK